MSGAICGENRSNGAEPDARRALAGCRPAGCSESMTESLHERRKERVQHCGQSSSPSRSRRSAVPSPTTLAKKSLASERRGT